METKNSVKGEQKNKPRISIRSAKEIYDTEYDEEQMLIDSLLPSIGLVLLCGAFKSGKSFFIQLLGHSLAAQVDFLGMRVNAICDCLYLALEDTERRLKKRFVTMAITPTDNLMITINWSHYKKGLNELKVYLKSNPHINVILIDTLGMFNKFREDAGFQADYDIMSEIREIAFEFRILIICTHHTRKLRDEHDVFNEISGSVGTMAAADTILLLKRPRNSNEALLHCLSRDYEECILKIKFDKRCRWDIIGVYDPQVLSPERQNILDILVSSPSELSPKQISEKIPRSNPKNISNLLNMMHKDGIVKTGAKRGLWMATEEKER